ncbi:hypothetical protein [Rhizobium sp. BK376]|uniref:hypothetical protein n=1 Tax=Rhizobium sp. BK376 TaxID=2512149 RepID=UPI001042A21C|nr:hypothetical protein [Rhizobium sp. BK376]TCR70723.1 hypothetical protein EV561_13835 [Rhizobium sp. BK376]
MDIQTDPRNTPSYLQIQNERPDEGWKVAFKERLRAVNIQWCEKHHKTIGEQKSFIEIWDKIERFIGGGSDDHELDLAASDRPDLQAKLSASRCALLTAMEEHTRVFKELLDGKLTSDEYDIAQGVLTDLLSYLKSLNDKFFQLLSL